MSSRRSIFVGCVLALLVTSAPSLGCTGDGDEGAESNSGSNESESAGESAQETGFLDTGETGETGDDLIMNACGTFDPNEPGDSVPPQDPDDPEIIEACTGLCEALDGVGGCMVDAEACVETCKLRSCQICPGTLAPLVECETQELDPAACSCTDGVVECPLPEACNELAGQTGACGG